MRLFKLSLAAAVAASTLALSASPLEEAIKDVDLSGFAMYRYNSYMSDSGTYAEHAFWSDVNFRATLDDNFFAVLGFEYVSGDVSGESTGRGGITNVGANAGANPGYYYNYEQTFNVKQIMLGYQAGNTTVQVGRQTLGTFFTDDSVGTGLKVLNTDIPGLTLAALAMDAIEDTDEDLYAKGFMVNNSKANQNNLYGIAAIGSYDPVSFQAWYAILENVVNIGALDVSGSFDLGAAKLGLQAQFAQSSFDGDWKTAGAVNAGVDANNNPIYVTADDATYWGLKASVDVAGFDAAAGYVTFDTDKDKHSLISLEDSGKYIKSGQNLLAYRGNYSYAHFAGENAYWFIQAGYSFLEKYRVGVEYVDGKNVTNSGAGTADITSDNTELVARASYQYSKKLGFSAFYSWLDYDVAGTKTKDDHFRFQAIYLF